MKKLLHVFLSLVFASAMVGTEAMADNKAPKVKEVKVDVCHIIEANDMIPFGIAPVYLYFGKVISLSEDAVNAHLAHGDSIVFFGGNKALGPIYQFRELGAHLPATNCYYGITLNGSILPTGDETDLCRQPSIRCLHGRPVRNPLKSSLIQLRESKTSLAHRQDTAVLQSKGYPAWI